MCQVLTQRILRNIATKPVKLGEESIRIAAKIGMTSNDATDIWSATLLMDTVKDALEIARHQNTANAAHFLVPKIANQ